MSLFKRIIKSLQRSRQRETLYCLQNMSDRQINDCGFSAELIAKGLKGWPWRIEDPTPVSSELEISQNIEQQHINELQRYSDKELADLGLCRGSIKESVRQGRLGIERQLTDRAA